MIAIADILSFNVELAMHERLYDRSIRFIIADRAGGGGWPPRNPQAVAGWRVVRMTAAVYGRLPREVAADVIEAYEHAETAAEIRKRQRQRQALRSAASTTRQK